MGSATERHDAMVRAYQEQRQRLSPMPEGFARWDRAATRFRADPRRDLDESLEVIAGWLRPDDVLLDVGGGSGRYGLPLALRCREVYNVEPSAGMGREFVASAAEAGIANAHNVEKDWLAAEGIEGDIALVVHVTYFVPQIEPFVRKLDQATRRRVIIGVGSTPPPNQGSDLFGLMHGETPALVPGPGELLAVLWEMGLMPEMRVAGSATGTAMGGVRIYPSRQEAIDFLARPAEQGEEQARRVREVAEQHFDELYQAVEGGFERRGTRGPKLLLITWEK